jgi:hypothetical protein
MLIGVDFDNTIVCYDELFHRLAVERGLISEDFPASKGEVRDFLKMTGREDVWTEMQGVAYGRRMLDAKPFQGTLDFFAWCSGQGISVCIISHRSRHPYVGPSCDLHEAAKRWIEHYRFYDRTGLSSKKVYFEITKEAKLRRVGAEGCRLFIDDLPEFLSESAFPEDVGRILFDPSNRYPDEAKFRRATSWVMVRTLVAKDLGGGR